MAALRVYRTGLTGAASTAKLRVYRTGLTGVAGASKLRVYRTGLAGGLAITVKPFAPLTVDPMVQQTTTIAANMLDGSTADSWAIRRISGAAVTLTQNGPIVSFPTPAVLAGTSVTLGFTATQGGATSAEATIVVTCLPQLKFVLSQTRQWIPAWSTDITPTGGGGGAPSGGTVLSTRIYPAAIPLVTPDPWAQVQNPRVRGVVQNRIRGLTGASVPGVAGAFASIPSSAMRVELFDISVNDVTATATAAATAAATTVQIDTATTPVYEYDFLQNNRTQEMLRVTAGGVSGTTVTVTRACQTSPPTVAQAILAGDTFHIYGGDVGDSGGNYATARAEVRGDYASPSNTPPRFWPHPVGSIRFLNFKVMLPSALSPTPGGTNWVVLTQIKGQYGGSPPVSIEMGTNGQYKLQLGAAADIYFGALSPRSMWREITLGLFLSPDPALGWVEVWFDGVNVIPRLQVATMEYQSDGVTPDPIYLKQGIYRPKAYVTTVGHTIYFGPLSVADSGQPFGAVL